MKDLTLRIKPARTCVGCREKRLTIDLVRLQADKAGRLCISDTLGGRGVWLCVATTVVCFDQARRKGNFTRALRRNLLVETMENTRAALVQRGNTTNQSRSSSEQQDE